MVDNIEKTILNCVKKFNGGFGKAGIVKILKGSDSTKKDYYTAMYYECAINSEFFGALKSLTKKAIEDAIDKLISEDKILKTGGTKPVLRYSVIDYSKIKPRKIEVTNEIRVKTADLKKQNQDRGFHEKLLKEDFGFNSFHNNQWKVISKILDYKKVLIIEKTGFGKSLCYQYPANLFYKQTGGLTLVFSPLLSLMRNQVKSLQEKGIRAYCLTGEQSFEENIDILQASLRGEVSMLYISPERLNNKILLDYISKIKLSMVVIDEAHCISQWGHDFRPSYRRILNLVTNLGDNFPILALSATATTKVIEDIKMQLGNNLTIIKGSLFRNNLQMHAIYCNDIEEKLYWILRMVENLNGTGLIYCAKKADTVLVSDWLNHKGIKSTYYHAGLDKSARTKIEQEFFEDKYRAIASTNALGMGVDKKDIRFIIHFQMPENLMSYYQEIGRAGRDGKLSQVVLLYNQKDKDLAKFFIETARPEIKTYKNAIRKLKFKPYSKEDLALKLELDEGQINTLINDLIDEGIIFFDSDICSFNPEAPELDEDYFIFEQQQKLKELEKMIGYTETKTCRMKYICSFFEDEVDDCKICDNCKKFNFKIENEGSIKEIKGFLYGRN